MKIKALFIGRHRAGDREMNASQPMSPPPPVPPSVDAYPPREIAHKVETLGVAKARTDALTMLVLAVLAGAFISLR